MENENTAKINISFIVCNTIILVLLEVHIQFEDPGLNCSWEICSTVAAETLNGEREKKWTNKGNDENICMIRYYTLQLVISNLFIF